MKILVRASIGITFGVVLLWVALSHVDVAQERQALGHANIKYMLVAVGVYWLAVAIRIVRWRLLLSGTNLLSIWQISQALIIGYAVNNVLPARLGEIFRADFLRRRFGVARSAALGSIIVERLLDGVAVLVLFGIGLATAGSLAGNTALLTAAVAGAAAVAIGLVTVYATILWHDRLRLDRFPWIAQRLRILVQGMMVMRGPRMIKAVAMSAVIWCFEAVAIYLILVGFRIDIAVGGLCLVVGAAALSTLLPSAPGYLGSLQVAFVLAYSALGLGPILGVLSATAVQLFLLGSITFVGLAMLLLSHVYGAAASVRRQENRDKSRVFGTSTH